MKQIPNRLPAAVVVVAALCVPARAQRVVITEFMASNDRTVLDEDGESSDWIELFNAGSSVVDLDGWYFTDDREELARWRIPPVSLAPGEFLLVFASGKDRRDPSSELHTNFKLSADGEYLALVRPDGVTVAMEFAPLYPFQFTDLSFGLPQGRTGTTFVGEGVPARAFVPAEDIGTSWRDTGFGDASWSQGTTGTGFDTGTDYDDLIGLDLDSAMRGVNASAYIRVPFEVADPSIFDSLTLEMKYDDGFVAYINGQEIARENSPFTPTWNSRATREHGQPRNGELVENFSGEGSYVLTAHGQNFAPRTLAGGPTGSYLELLRDNQGGLVNTVGFPRVFGVAESVEAAFDFRMPTEESHTGCCGERADGFGFALCDTTVYGESGPGPAADNIVWERPVFPGVFSVGFDIFNGEGTENTVSLNWNGVQVAERLVSAFPLNNGVFNRCEVDVRADGPDSLVSVTLTPDSLGNPGQPVVVFDDMRILGMAPFENRVAFGGRTGGAFISLDLDNIDVRYSSSVSGDIPYESFRVAEHLDALAPGSNVLAIHGLNRDVDDADFLVLPRLEGVEVGDVDTGTFHYFSEPTPGEINSSGVPGFAERPRFSRDAGGFSSAFDLELDVTSPSAEVRYTLNRSEPTASSTRYTGPIRIGSTTVVKARTFQDGLLPSPTVTNFYFRLAADVRTFDSNLPLVVLDTFGQGVGQGSQTPTWAVFVDTDSATGRAPIDGAPDFQGRAGIKHRGSSSLQFPKKMFAFETWDPRGNDLSVKILGFPREADYVLYAPYSDKSLMRNVLAYEWSNRIGRYAARTRFYELFLNTDGNAVASSDYHGVYVFMEKIKRDDDRVDVEELLPTQNSEPEISGGYIIKKDRLDPGDSGFLTSRGQRLAYVEPKEREITPAQSQWLRSYMNSFEAALYGPSFRDPLNGYARYIDADSFIDHHILVEMLKNIDGFRLSTFFYKDRGEKLRMGPIWDYNLSLGNANYLQGWISSRWYYPQISAEQYPYFPRLFQDPDFEQRYIDRWTELRRDEFRTEELLATIDATAAYLAESQARNFARWPVLGTYVWPNWFIADTWAEEISWMKGWLRDRLAWFDSNYLSPPIFSRDGGLVEPGFELQLGAPAGTVYYTLDGTDPRLPGGAVAPGALSTGSASETVLVSSSVSGEVRAFVPPDGALGGSWTLVGFDDGGWLRATTGVGVGYESGSGYESFIDLDVGSEMDGVHPAIYIRVPFTVEDPADFQTLTLRMRYDDGFVAHLNGREIASRNAPATVSWDSSATTLHDDGEAVVFESIDVGAHLDTLRAGENVLAIQGLNERTGSSDLLIEPELVAGSTFDGESIVIEEPTHVTARARDGGRWSGLVEATFVFESDLPLRITELMYHPSSLPQGSPFSGADLEFIEILNTGPVPVDLSGVRFVDGVLFDFTMGSVEQLGPGEYVLVVRSLDAFTWFYGTEGKNIAGEYELRLDNGGELVRMVDGADEVILEFAYDDTWYPETDGGGRSLVIVDPFADAASWNLASSWSAGTVLDGTPGAPEGELPPRRGFQRAGDANQDASVDIADAIRLLQYLFAGAAPLPCDGDGLADGGNRFVLDVNEDARVDLTDTVHLLRYLFLAGSPPGAGTDCVRVEGCPEVCRS